MHKSLSEILKTIGQGTLGAMTLSAYHQYTITKIMDLHNQKLELQHKYFTEQHKTDINELKEKIHTLQQKLEKKWW